MLLRTLLSTVIAAGAFAVPAAHALTIKPYNAADLSAAQGAGAPVAVHFHADWCSTCKAQEKAFSSLKADPALDKLTLLVADYDKEKPLMKTLNVTSRSVLVVFKGKTEVARNNGDTSAEKLKDTLVKAL